MANFFFLFPLFMVFIFSAENIFCQTSTIPVGHSHNDYTRKRPLYDALETGFMSVEVDVFYRNGKFLVAHTVLGIRKRKTLEKLYLEPLQKIANKNSGKIYPNSAAPLELMIDTKGAWTNENIRELERLLASYKNLWVIYNGENEMIFNGAIRVLLSGGGYTGLIKNDNPRLLSVDAGLGDIKSDLPAEIIGRNSAHYRSVLSWRGRGNIPSEEKEKLQQICAEAKLYNRKVRLWACPNKTQVWKVLLDAGVGWVNVDKLKKFRAYYLEEYLPESIGSE